MGGGARSERGAVIQRVLVARSRHQNALFGVAPEEDSGTGTNQAEGEGVWSPPGKQLRKVNRPYHESELFWSDWWKGGGDVGW